MPDAQLQSIGRVRTMSRWLRRTSLPAEVYPKRSSLTAEEVEDAKRFAVGMYPTPARWTVRLYNMARQG